jgi:hypothetical protein
MKIENSTYRYGMMDLPVSYEGGTALYLYLDNCMMALHLACAA